MKLLPTAILSILLLTCCTGRQDSMRHEMEHICQLNREGKPFTVADVQPLVDYFDRHGSPNDRLLAYYLLGRAYHEKGEMPMALQYYQQAAESVDTVNTQCDFLHLSRVHSQMGQLYYQQSLYREYLCHLRLAERYALVAKDTLSAITNYGLQNMAYRALQKPDSAVYIAERTAQMYRAYGRPQYAAITLGSIANQLIMQGEYVKARKYMALYESESGWFDADGNIQKGREIYYHFKGMLYLHEHRPDSAEYWFRKELTDGRDFNNQNGGALGLARVYEQYKKPDSVAKYAQYAYAMNDSMHSRQVPKDVARISALYNYSRYQKQAYQENEKATQRIIVIWVCVGLICLVSAISYAVYKDISRKRQELEQKYWHSLSIIEQAHRDIAKLQNHQTDNSSLIAEKEGIIREQEEFLRKLQANVPIYRKFAIKGQEMTADEWKMIRDEVFQLLPGFQRFMEDHILELNDKEYKTCILIRAGFKPKIVSSMLSVGPSYISGIRTKMLSTIFYQEGNSKDFDRQIRNIF